MRLSPNDLIAIRYSTSFVSKNYSLYLAYISAEALADTIVSKALPVGLDSSSLMIFTIILKHFTKPSTICLPVGSKAS